MESAVYSCCSQFQTAAIMNFCGENRIEETALMNVKITLEATKTAILAMLPNDQAQDAPASAAFPYAPPVGFFMTV